MVIHQQTNFCVWWWAAGRVSHCWRWQPHPHIGLLDVKGSRPNGWCALIARFAACRQNGNEVFNVNAVARAGASAVTDCLASYAQILGGAWWLPLASNQGVSNSTEQTFVDCVQRCGPPNCQMATYDYTTKMCSIRNWITPQYVG